MIRIFDDFTNVDQDEVISNIETWLAKYYMDGAGIPSELFDKGKKLLFDNWQGEENCSCSFIDCDDNGAIIIPADVEDVAFSLAWELLNKNSYIDEFGPEILERLVKEIKNAYPMAEIYGWICVESQNSGTFVYTIKMDGNRPVVSGGDECDYDAFEDTEDLEDCSKEEFVSKLEELIESALEWEE